MENDVKEVLEQARPKLELEKQKQELEKLTQEKEQEIKKKKEESIFTLLLFFYSCFILF
ncbi:centriole proteome protein [Helicobacter pylori]|nr:centriole proteome protein [Helicobacter pylori]